MFMNNKEKKSINLTKRQSITIITVLSVVLVLLALLNSIDFDAIIENMFKKDEPTVEYNFFFYTPDYDTDIMNDPEYIELDRSVALTEGAVKMYNVDLDEFEGTSVIKDYLDAMINGDATAYAGVFTDEYKQEPKNFIPERFPQQRLYNITVERLTEPYMFKETDLEGKYTGIIRHVFSVSYMIQYNTGTVRNDIDSESMRPITVEVFEYPDQTQKINAIAFSK